MPFDDVVPDEDREVELVIDDQDPGAQNPYVDLARPDDEPDLPIAEPEPDRPA
jgi:hypothetical protein